MSHRCCCDPGRRRIAGFAASRTPDGPGPNPDHRYPHEICTRTASVRHCCGSAGRLHDIGVPWVWLSWMEDHDRGILRWHSSRGFHNDGIPGQHRISPAAPATPDTPAARQAGARAGHGAGGPGGPGWPGPGRGGRSGEAQRCPCAGVLAPAPGQRWACSHGHAVRYVLYIGFAEPAPPRGARSARTGEGYFGLPGRVMMIALFAGRVTGHWPAVQVRWAAAASKCRPTAPMSPGSRRRSSRTRMARSGSSSRPGRKRCLRSASSSLSSPTGSR